MTTDNFNILELIKISIDVIKEEILSTTFFIGSFLIIIVVRFFLKRKAKSIWLLKIIFVITFMALPFSSGYLLYKVRSASYTSEQGSIFFSDVIYGPSIAFIISLLFFIMQELDPLFKEQENLPTIKIKTESATIESSSTSLNADEIEVTAENIDVSSSQISVDAKNTTANATQANIVSSKADIKTQTATIRNVAESSDTKEPK